MFILILCSFSVDSIVASINMNWVGVTAADFMMPAFLSSGKGVTVTVYDASTYRTPVNDDNTYARIG